MGGGKAHELSLTERSRDPASGKEEKRGGGRNYAVAGIVPQNNQRKEAS